MGRFYSWLYKSFFTREFFYKRKKCLPFSGILPPFIPLQANLSKIGWNLLWEQKGIMIVRERLGHQNRCFFWTRYKLVCRSGQLIKMARWLTNPTQCSWSLMFYSSWKTTFSLCENPLWYQLHLSVNDCVRIREDSRAESW